jgi:hypothetical protein
MQVEIGMGVRERVYALFPTGVITGMPSKRLPN